MAVSVAVSSAVDFDCGWSHGGWGLLLAVKAAGTPSTKRAATWQVSDRPRERLREEQRDRYVHGGQLCFSANPPYSNLS